MNFVTHGARIFLRKFFKTMDLCNYYSKQAHQIQIKKVIPP
jgi:hypothetical protein